MKAVKPNTDPTAILDLTKVSYGNHTIFQKQYDSVILSTTDSALIKFGESTAEIFNNLIEKSKEDVEIDC